MPLPNHPCYARKPCIDIEHERMLKANQFIRTIGTCGRRFFSSNSSKSLLDRNPEFCHFSINETGRVFFWSFYHQEYQYTHYQGRWKNFHHGGTLKSLVIDLRDYIKKGERLDYYYFNPQWSHGRSNPWGYSAEALKTVQDKGVELGIICYPDEVNPLKAVEV